MLYFRAPEHIHLLTDKFVAFDGYIPFSPLSIHIASQHFSLLLHPQSFQVP